jgi:hypothetical protein
VILVLASVAFCCLLLESFLSLRIDRLAENSPNGESLSFVSAKESNQRKTDPGSARKPDENQQFQAPG